MASFKTKDRVLETSTTTGTGDYTLAGAATGFQAFVGGVVSANDLVPYYAEDGTNWEAGIGTVLSGPARLQRTHVLSSSTAGAAVNWGAGTRNLRCGWPAELDTPRMKSVSIAGGAGDQTLTQTEQRCDVLILTGALTGNRGAVVDATPWRWAAVINNTIGAFTATLKVSGLTGVPVAKGKSKALFCNGTDVKAAEPDWPISGRKMINGLTYANNGADATNDIDIAAGGCMDATGEFWIELAALTKQSDVAWAVGTAAGGLDTGAVGNSDYYIWAIARSDTGVTDVLFSLSSTAPTMPANYDFKRLIGWFKRVAAAIVPFHIYETEGGGVEMNWDVPTLDINLANTLTTTRRTDAVKVPLGFSVTAILSVYVVDAATTFAAWITCPDHTDAAAGVPNAANIQATTPAAWVVELRIRTSSAGLIAARAGLATVDTYQVSTYGFTWARRN